MPVMIMVTKRTLDMLRAMSTEQVADDASELEPGLFAIMITESTLDLLAARTQGNETANDTLERILATNDGKVMQ